MARDISTVRLEYGLSFAVNEQGEAVEQINQSEPRYTCVENGISFAEWADCAAWLGLDVEEPAAPAETLGTDESVAVELEG